MEEEKKKKNKTADPNESPQVRYHTGSLCSPSIQSYHFTSAAVWSHDAGYTMILIMRLVPKNCLLIEFLQLHMGKKRLCKELTTNYCRNQIAMKTTGKKLQIKVIKQCTLTAKGKLDNKTQLPTAQTPIAELKEVKV